MNADRIQCRWLTFQITALFAALAVCVAVTSAASSEDVPGEGSGQQAADETDAASSAEATPAEGDQTPDAAAETSDRPSVGLWRALGAIFGAGGGRDRDDPFLELLGQLAPAFALESLDGDKVRLEDFRGRVVVLDFWATWCPPCMAAMPELEKLHAGLADRPVTIIGVNQREQPDAIREVIEQKGLTFLQMLDKDGAVADSFRVSGIPQTVLIDPAGVVQAVHVGYSPRMKATLSGQIDRLLAGEQIFDAEKVAKARARVDQRREAIVAQLAFANEERLERLENVLEDEHASIESPVRDSQWLLLPGESERALCIFTGEKRLVIVRPAPAPAETLDLELSDEVSVWGYAPAPADGKMHWVVVGVEYDDDYNFKQLTLRLFDSQGQPLWSKAYPALENDSYLDNGVAAGDLTGDGVPEIAVLVEHDSLSEAGISGPGGSTRILSVYDLKGDLLLRTWAPGHGGAGLHVLPGADGNTLLMATSEGLTRFRIRP